MAESISQLFRLPADGKPMTIMQLAGFPAEVVDPVVSVLCRLAFDFGLWSDGAAPLLIVCEEAHRYASVDRTIGFGPTRRAISRIAKEGRKCGVFLALATQRPAELDPTIISQCSTLFAMRMSNDRDQALLRSAVSDAAANLFGFVPSLGTREALAFGVGVPLPTRLTFSELPPQIIPRSEAFAGEQALPTANRDLSFIAAVLERWRGSMARVRRRRTSRDPRPAVASRGGAAAAGCGTGCEPVQPVEEAARQSARPVRRAAQPGLDADALIAGEQPRAGASRLWRRERRDASDGARAASTRRPPWMRPLAASPPSACPLKCTRLALAASSRKNGLEK